MNVKKPVDYNAMFASLDTLIAADLPQMKLYCEIGKLIGIGRKKVPLLLQRSICASHTLTFLAFLPGTCAGCGISTALMKATRKCWLKP